jgi:hypothetical protein
MRPLVIVLAFALAIGPAIARADEQSGRAVELESGEVAPFKGSLSDAEFWASVLAKRRAAELTAQALELELQSAKAAREKAERERDSKVSAGALAGGIGVALVVGLAVGVALTYALRK